MCTCWIETDFRMWCTNFILYASYISVVFIDFVIAKRRALCLLCLLERRITYTLSTRGIIMHTAACTAKVRNTPIDHRVFMWLLKPMV